MQLYYLKISNFQTHINYRLWAFPVTLPSGECHKTSLIIYQLWFRWWLVLSGNKPLPEPLLTQVVWCCMASLEFRDSLTMCLCFFSTCKFQKAHKIFQFFLFYIEGHIKLQEYVDKQRVLMHRHQGWNVRHGLCHIYMRYIYIWVVYSFCLFCCLFIIVHFCLFCCLFIIVTWWYIWCIVWQVASKRKYRHVW